MPPCGKRKSSLQLNEGMYGKCYGMAVVNGKVAKVVKSQNVAKVTRAAMTITMAAIINDYKLPSPKTVLSN